MEQEYPVIAGVICLQMICYKTGTSTFYLKTIFNFILSEIWSEREIELKSITKTWSYMIHHYYSPAQNWNIISVLRLNVLTFKHTMMVKNMFPPSDCPKLYSLYFHFLDVHIPVINRMFCLFFKI